MDEKWYKKVSKLLHSKEKENGLIYFNGYLCNLIPEGYMKDKLIVKMFGFEKELGYISDLIKINDKDDFNSLKEELEKIKILNFECTEDEFKLKIKSLATVKKELDDYKVLMTVYEVKANEYNSIRLCEYEDGTYKYEKWEGHEKHHGKTKLTFSNNMSYELIYLINVGRLQANDKNVTFDSSNIVKKQEKNPGRSIEELFSNNIEERTQEVEVVYEEIEIKPEIVDANEKYKVFSDYLAIKIAKHLYGLDWRLSENLIKLADKDFVVKFKEEYPLDYEHILKELLIESRCLIKKMSK